MIILEVRIIFFVHLYHILINRSVIGWFSGFGALSAALVALFNNRKRSPHLIYRGYCDPQYEELIIQIVNDSKTTDFVELENILFSDKKTKWNQNNKVIIPKALRIYEIFHAVKGEDVYTIIMNKKDISKLLKKYFKSGKKYLIFNFKELSKGQVILIPFLNKEIEGYAFNKLRKEIKITTKMVHSSNNHK